MNETDYTYQAILKKAKDGLDQYQIPGYMQPGIMEWIAKARPVGGFLTAVFEGKLFEAANRADETNARLLWNYCAFLYNCAPAACFGSPEKVQKWAKHQGLLFTEDK